MFDFYHELAKGGWVMIPIGAVSVLALGLFLERVFTLRRVKVYPAGLVLRVRELILARRFSEALSLCQQNGSSIALVLSAGLMRQGEPRSRIKEAVEDRGRAEAGRLDRFIEGLGTIAAIAPLLGLLGTVLGMIDVFRIVDNYTKANPGAPVDPGLLATGIWKALITTAAGLVVAIPTFVGYKYLVTRINRMILEMEESATDLTDLFIRVLEGDAAQSPVTVSGATADDEETSSPDGAPAKTPDRKTADEGGEADPNEDDTADEGGEADPNEDDTADEGGEADPKKDAADHPEPRG